MHSALIAASLLFFTNGVAMERGIQGIYRGAGPHMVGDGFQVMNYFPSGNKIDVSPFILLDYMIPSVISPSDAQKGVGAHPHRGFETVTLLYDGAISHRDSHGGGGTIYAGDIQWMTAGSGVLHEEFHEKEFAKQGGKLHGIQLWVNLPKKFKMTEPRYQTLTNHSIQRKSLDDKGSYLRVIAGNFQEITGTAQTHSPMQVYDAFLKKGSTLHVELLCSDNSLILVMEGAISVNGKKGNAADLILFNHQGNEVEIQSVEDAAFLVLSGEPLGEPVVHYGPFVMNTKAEIDQAFKDYQSGKFGTL